MTSISRGRSSRWRNLVAVLTALGLLLTIAGAGPAQAKKTKKTTKKKTATTKKRVAQTTKKATPVAGPNLPKDLDPNGILRVGLDLANSGGLRFDPTKMATGQYTSSTPVLRTLLVRDSDGNIKPELAQSAKVVNPTTVEVNLRPNLKFSDGTPLDSAAVKATFQRNLASNNTQGLQITDMQLVSSIEVNSPTKFTIHLVKPSAGVVYLLLAGVEFAPMSPTQFNAEGDVSQDAVGAGPMKIVDYVPNNRVTMVKNPYYFNADKVTLAGMQYVHVTAGAAVINALRSGQIDYMSIAPDQAVNMIGNLKASADRMTAAMTIQWCIKDGTPLGNTKVRQAVAYALDRDRFNGIIYDGRSSEAYDLFPANNKFHDKSLDGLYKRDISKAKQLLTEAGFPNGFKFSMAVGPGAATTQAEVIQGMLKDAGIDMSVTTTNNIGADYYTTARFDATLSQSRPGPFDKVSRFYLSDSFSNACKYPNPQVDALYAKVAGLDLEDPAAVPLWKQLSNVLFKDEAFFPQITWQVDFKGYNTDRVGNLTFYWDQLGGRQADPVGTYIKK